MGIVRRGVHKHLEDQATRMIQDDLRRRGITKHSEKKDILTPWKEAARYRREVYNENGVADATIRRGLYHRSSNKARPDLNSRDGSMPSPSRTRYPQGLAEHVIRDRKV